jgi:hypothetical protein
VRSVPSRLQRAGMELYTTSENVQDQRQASIFERQRNATESLRMKYERPPLWTFAMISKHRSGERRLESFTVTGSGAAKLQEKEGGLADTGR